MPENEIRTVKFKRDQKQKLRKQLRDHYDEGKSSFGDWSSRHDRRYRRYLTDVTLRPEGPWPESPRLFTSHTRRNLEKICGELWQACLGSDEAIKVEAWNAENLHKAKRATMFERWALSEAINEEDRGGWDYISFMAIMDALMDSLGVLKVYRWSPPWNRPEGDAGRWLDSIVRIDNVDQSYLLIPPGAQGLQYPEAGYLGERLFMRMDDLKRKKKEDWKVPDEDELKPKIIPLDARQKHEQEREGLKRNQREDQYEVVESYERFALDEYEEDLVVHWYPDVSGESDHWLARAAYMTDIFPAHDRPRRPYFPIACWLQPRQLRGLNVPDRMQTPQDILNRLHEQMIGYGEISMLPFFFVDALVTGDIPDLRQIKPGQGVPVNSMNGVQFATRQSLNKHFQEQIHLQGAEVESDMHVSDASLGRSGDRPNQQRTASGQAMIMQAGKQSWGVEVHHLKNQFQAVLNFHFQLEQMSIQPGLQARIGKPNRRFPLARKSLSAGTSPLLDPMNPFPAGEPVVEGELVESPDTSDGMITEENRQNLAERVLGPSKDNTGEVVAETITKDELSGVFDVRLTVNPNGEYDRQVLTALTEQLLPILQQYYPLGLQKLIARIWELYDQQGFDQIMPEAIATIWTQVVAEQTQVSLLELKVKESQLKAALEQIQNPQGMSPDQQRLMQEQMALQEATIMQQAEQIQMMSAISQADMQAQITESQESIVQAQEKTKQAKIGTVAAAQKVKQQLQDASQKKAAAQHQLENQDAAAEQQMEHKDLAAEQQRTQKDQAAKSKKTAPKGKK